MSLNNLKDLRDRVMYLVSRTRKPKVLSTRDEKGKCLELIELYSVNKVSLVWVSSCSNTGSIRDDPYWSSRKNSLELIELSSINKISLV